MLILYQGLEDMVTSTDKAVSGTEKARCAEVAANIAIDVIKAESQGIKAIKELVAYGNNKGNNRLVQSIQSSNRSGDTATTELRDNNTNNNDKDDDINDDGFNGNRKF
jgi:hypothetical protein